VNLILNWTLPALSERSAEKIKLMLGYAHFRPGAFVKNVADSTTADWFFAQVHYRYRF
jgi:hypothetical protein